VPTAAIRHAQPEDLFWAARRVVAFSDDMIRALVKTAEFSDPNAEAHLGDVLIQRRNKIGAAYLATLNPVVNFDLSPGGHLSFENAAANAGVAPSPPEGYRVTWERFDNDAGTVEPLGASIVRQEEAAAPAPLPASPDGFVRVSVSAIQPAPQPWSVPVFVYFRRTMDGWKLVGIDRTRE
jgi:hypothetical protein